MQNDIIHKFRQYYLHFWRSIVLNVICLPVGFCALIISQIVVTPNLAVEGVHKNLRCPDSLSRSLVFSDGLLFRMWVAKIIMLLWPCSAEKFEHCEIRL